jgi:hypothetical protein
MSVKQQTYATEQGQQSEDFREDRLTRTIEKQTARVPSTGFLGAAIAAMAGSAVLLGFNKKQAALFVGQWAAPFLLLGIYNKMVKQHGSDRTERQGAAAASY